ncbi:hypothetical protein BDN70DRAFT_874876 [Pholiota conissans]|uniref:2'-phosphotransferase n=1 Tax=Pholiota conissans TaxID=109636 RepID=A0A9P5Z812_9AGAR|nr:hypothetical protein BDN70DRAFT_874876 [Pholiota conissans]
MNFLGACTRRLLYSVRAWPSAIIRRPTPQVNSPTVPSVSFSRHHSTIFTKLQFRKYKYTDEHFVHFTDKLIYVLRRMTGREIGLENRDDEYVSVKLLLNHPEFHCISMPALQKVIDTDVKHRFSLKFDPTKQNDSWWLRARRWNESYYYLKPLRPDSKKAVSHAVYRTTLQEWHGHISRNGIPRLHEEYIRLECGIFTESYLQDMSSLDEVLVFVDIEAAMKAGLRFFIPTPPPQPNAKPIHLVTAGNEYGYIPPDLFAEVDRVQTKKTLLWGDEDPAMQKAILLSPEDLEKHQNPATYLRPLDRNITGFVHFPITQRPPAWTIEEAKAVLTRP